MSVSGTGISVTLVEGLAAMLRGEAVPWQTLGVAPAEAVEACEREGISCLVHARLSSQDGGCDWPPAVARSLAQLSRARSAAELLIEREIAAVLDLLGAEGIHPVLLKGAPLAYTVYAMPAGRPRDDTDLIIRRDEVERLSLILAERGYVAPPLCGGELLFCQFQLTKRDRFGITHSFDVHWKISTQAVFADLLTYEELAQVSRSIPVLGANARAPEPVYALLLACIHPVMHHRNEAPLIWVHDVHLLASQLSTAQFVQFSTLARAKRIGTVCARQLSMARARFHTRIPDEVLNDLAGCEAEPSAEYLRLGRRWHDELFSSLRALPGWTNRVRLLREVVVPSSRYMFDAYGIERHGGGRALLPALYVHRAMSGAWKVLTCRK